MFKPQALANASAINFKGNIIDFPSGWMPFCTNSGSFARIPNSSTAGRKWAGDHAHADVRLSASGWFRRESTGVAGEAGLASYDHVTTEAAPLQVARFAVTSAYGAGRWLADCLHVGGALLGGPCLALPSSSPRWRCSGGTLSGSGPAGRLGVRAAGYPRVEGPSSDRKGSPVAGCWDSSLRTGVTVPARGAGGMGWWLGGHLGPRGLRCGQGCWGAGKDTDPGELGHHRCWRLPIVDPTSRQRWETLVRCFATCVWSDS